MREAVLQHGRSATIVIKAAAVADYRVRALSATKIKGKRDLTLDLTPNPDILKEVAAAGTGAFIVGFAAETHDVVASAEAKLASKGVDLLVVNDVSQVGIGFDAEDNEVLLLDRRRPHRRSRSVPRSKRSGRRCRPIARPSRSSFITASARRATSRTPPTRAMASTRTTSRSR